MVSLVTSIVSWLQGSPRTEIVPANNKADISYWYKVLNSANSYDEWKTAAERLDELEGNNEWKRQRTSPLYDHNRLGERIRRMHELEVDDKIESVIFWLRSGLLRNLGGIGNRRLYDHCHLGTKYIIEQHADGIRRLLTRVADCEPEEMSLEKRLAFFTESRHSLGKTALLCSGGAKLGMFHLGVIKALSEQGLLPRIIAGSSAGAIIAAVVGVCNEEELWSLSTQGLHGFFSAFAKQFIGSMMNTKLKRIITTGHMMEVKKLQQALKELIGDFTFHEAYERTGRIINITVSPGNAFEKPRLLNYLTAPNVLLWSAATASCAFTEDHAENQLWIKATDGTLQPYSLRYQQNGTWEATQLNDNQSLHTDLPMNRLQELFNVNFFIVSQTNPHAIPFLQKFQKSGRDSRPTKPGLVGRFFGSMTYMVRSEVLHRCRQAITLGLAPRLLKLTLDQKYVGDVTIVPPFSVEHYRKIFDDPTWDSCEFYVHQGERCTWANSSQIRGQCQLEYVLDECVKKVSAKIQAEHQRQQAEEELRRQQSTESVSVDSSSGVAGALSGEVSPDAPMSPARTSTPVSTTFTASFRQQRHTHLDLNDFFSKGQSAEVKKLGHTKNLAALTSFTSADGDSLHGISASPDGSLHGIPPSPDGSMPTDWSSPSKEGQDMPPIVPKLGESESDQREGSPAIASDDAPTPTDAPGTPELNGSRSASEPKALTMSPPAPGSPVVSRRSRSLRQEGNLR